jgi:hypothetical protein
MSDQEQREHREAELVVRSALSALRLLSRLQDEDLQVAMARLDNWLSENSARWVK